MNKINTIGVINLGNSNLKSLTNSLDFLEITYIIVDSPSQLINVDKIILPGVGTFGNGMKRLTELNLISQIIEDVTVNKKPILGICLGMQLLFESSEESIGVKGLSLIKGKAIQLPKSSNYHLPRIGWAESEVQFEFLGLQKEEKIDFYYIHSFYVKPLDETIISISTDNGITAAIKYNHIYGCQFHPEKSHVHGLNILKNFSKLDIVKED